MKIFDLLNSPLAGTNLIEASAGTGKTYTIAGLYLRLILEHQLSPDQILVVTFTNAATEELKDRIRNGLVLAHKAFVNKLSPDKFINAVAQNYRHPARALSLINDALVDFDKAAIYTIHGFCQRILHENAFETNSLFDTELATDPFELMQAITDDFWRTHIYSLPPELISYITQRVAGPEYFLGVLSQKKSPEIDIVPKLKQPPLSVLDEYRNACRRLKKAWPSAKADVYKLLMDPALSGTTYGSLTSRAGKDGLSKRELNVLSMLASMDQWADSDFPVFPPFKGFEKFTAAKLKSATRKNHITPRHDIFDICDSFNQKSAALEIEMEQYLLFLRAECFKFAGRELAARKRDTNIQFFDDLLLIVKKALEGQDQNTFAQAIRRQYKAALVDEFQDTDAVQYEIFSGLFASKQNPLFMIGDPKQSIYSFRGADIFSYLKASRQSDSRFTLIKNWRSSPGLITAINTIFSNAQAPFVFEQIPFVKGESGQQQQDDQKKPPLTFWYLLSEKNKPVNKTRAVSMIAGAVAAEISRLISRKIKNNLSSDQKRIHPGEIAVLVRTNRQAQVVKAHLSSKQIPSVLYSAGNIFQSHEALEMERVLAGIAEPGNDRRLKSALVTDMMGVSGQELELHLQTPLWRETRFSAFAAYLRLWRQYGFIRMFRQFMADEKVKGRLLAFPDGERRLTNVLHLGEILHKQSIEKQPGITGLIRWLSKERQTALPDVEANQLRLESDEHAVKIVTIHKSKGLEYPVVFCPFGWEGSLIRKEAVSFHDKDNHDRLTLDLDIGRNDNHINQAQMELLAENLRLLYVAVTRARKYCYLAWGRINTAETSALAYLLHAGQIRPEDIKRKDFISALQTTVTAKQNKEWLADLRQLADRSGGTIELLPLAVENGKAYESPQHHQETNDCRHFSGAIDNSWKISSYSYLISRRTMDNLMPDHDAEGDSKQRFLQDQQRPSDFSDIFSFPKGARAGIFFHDLFERLDFAAQDPTEQEQLVIDRLKVYGFDLEWKAPICSMIKKVLSAPLQIGSRSLTLSKVKPKDRINEMQFYFPINRLTPGKLKRIFEIHGDTEISAEFPEQIGKLSFPITKGFMKGYVDLILQHQEGYILVDWKSNYLGSQATDYDKTALGQTMHNKYYILQYHLYVLALHRYLRMRKPNYCYETDFKGVFYFFIRGVDPDQGPDLGIYRHLPSPDIIKALEKALIPGC